MNSITDVSPIGIFVPFVNDLLDNLFTGKICGMYVTNIAEPFSQFAIALQKNR
jgi:hypothetical protein